MARATAPAGVCIRGSLRPPGLPIPILAALPLHRDASRIAHLDPDRARSGSIGAVHPLGDDTLGAKPASVRKYGRAILGDVFVKQDAGLGIAQQSRKHGLAIEKRPIAQVLAIVLDQIKGVEHSPYARHPVDATRRIVTSRLAPALPPCRRS